MTKKPATKKPKPKPEGYVFGRPPEYRSEFAQMLIDHMKGGGSLTSFAGTIGTTRQTLYNWLEAHENFLYARKTGEGLLHKFYEELGKAMATGQLRRLRRETPVLDPNGKPVYDNEGRPMMTREYEPATPGQAAYIFLCKNLLKYRDRVDVNHGGQDAAEGGKPVQFDFSGMTLEQVQSRMDELALKALGKK